MEGPDGRRPGHHSDEKEGSRVFFSASSGGRVCKVQRRGKEEMVVVFVLGLGEKRSSRST